MREIILLSLLYFISAFKYKGITFTNGKYCPNVTFLSDAASYSLEQLASTGANSIAIIVTEVIIETLNLSIN
jgi:hypothetical protein